jgi:hypothetical protein
MHVYHLLLAWLQGRGHQGSWQAFVLGVAELVLLMVANHTYSMPAAAAASASSLLTVRDHYFTVHMLAGGACCAGVASTSREATRLGWALWTPRVVAG